MNIKSKFLFILAIVTAILIIIFGYNSSKKYDNENKNKVSIKDVIKMQEWEENDGTIYNNLEYKNGLTYNLYIPSQIDKSKDNAVILLLHGGSWESGSKIDMDYFCKVFTKAGYITCAMDYSLLNSSGNVTFYKMLDDITLCFSAIKNKADELEIKLKNCAIYGYSAGGHLALLYSYSRKDECPLNLKFVTVEAGPTDFHKDAWDEYDDAFLKNSLLRFTGVKVDDLNSELAENTIKTISPISFINEKTLPTILGYGTSDTLVRPVHYKKLEKCLKDNKVKYDLIEFKGMDHALFLDAGTQAKFYAKTIEYANELLK